MERKKYYRAFVVESIRQMCESLDELNRVIRENRYTVKGDIEVCYYYRIDSCYGRNKGHYGRNLQDATSRMGMYALNSIDKIMVQMEDGTFEEIEIPNMSTQNYSLRRSQWDNFLSSN